MKKFIAVVCLMLVCGIGFCFEVGDFATRDIFWGIKEKVKIVSITETETGIFAVVKPVDKQTTYEIDLDKLTAIPGYEKASEKKYQEAKIKLNFKQK